MHTLQRACTQMRTLCHNTCLTYTPTHAWCSKHLSECLHTPRKKCTCTRECMPMQHCRNFFAMETISKLSWVLCEHCAGCRLPSALLLSRWNQSPDAVRSRNPSKSTLAHDTVRQRRCGVAPGFLATRVLPGAIKHSILRTSVKPWCIPLSNRQDPETVSI